MSFRPCFVECTVCAAKSGSPILCESCLTNRLAIANATEEIERLESDLEMMRDLVRTLSPGIGRVTRHTITVPNPIPTLEAGHSLLIQVLPAK